MEKEVRREDGTGTLLFVYGTLRKGFRAHSIMQRLHARFLETGHVRGRLYDLGEYPGAVPSVCDAERVQGEIYLLPNATQAFRVIDRFEGFDPANSPSNLFERKQATVVLATGGRTQAWIYWLGRARPFGRRVTSGNYAMHGA
jgi:gamma-glutamylcyclotransferase (GGCT)/AIG2-like uncharacterized protein YtfP